MCKTSIHSVLNLMFKVKTHCSLEKCSLLLSPIQVKCVSIWLWVGLLVDRPGIKYFFSLTWCHQCANVCYIDFFGIMLVNLSVLLVGHLDYFPPQKSDWKIPVAVIPCPCQDTATVGHSPLVLQKQTTFLTQILTQVQCIFSIDCKAEAQPLT